MYAHVGCEILVTLLLYCGILSVCYVAGARIMKELKKKIALRIKDVEEKASLVDQDNIIIAKSMHHPKILTYYYMQILEHISRMLVSGYTYEVLVL